MGSIRWHEEYGALATVDAERLTGANHVVEQAIEVTPKLRSGSAREVDGAPFGVIGFAGAAVDGKHYTGVGDAAQSVVYEVDPETGAAVPTFTMDGYFYGLSRL